MARRKEGGEMQGGDEIRKTRDEGRERRRKRREETRKRG
jgi:hypothetical protein